MKKTRLLVGMGVAVVLGTGLYVVNRQWIVPLSSRPAVAAGSHPLAPEFSLKDINGNKLDLEDYQGKVVLLDFWATWCGPCRIEIPEFVEFQKRYRDQGFSVIGISMDDSVEPVRDFYQQFKMNYPVAVGNSKLAELYGGIFGLPTTMVIGRDGRIYAKHMGATDGSIFDAEIQELLRAQGRSELVDFKGLGRAQTENITLGDPVEVNSEVPGVNLSKLPAKQIEAFKKHLEKIKCTCGCNWDLLQCRTHDRACGTSLAMAREELKKFLKSPSSPTPPAPSSVASTPSQ